MNARQNERQEFAVLHARSMWSAMKNINESGRSSLCIVITVSFFLREMKFRDLRFHKEFADFFAESFTLDSDDQKQAASEATTRIANSMTIYEMQFGNSRVTHLKQPEPNTGQLWRK